MESLQKKYLPVPADHSILMALLISFGILLSSCGYRFAGSGNLPPDIKAVHIEIFQNSTAEIGAEHIFTNDLVFEFTRNGNPPVSREDADGVITGRIDSMQIQTISRKGQITSLERRLTALLSIKLTDRNGRVIWSESDISYDEAYGVFSEKVATDYAKRIAVQEISKRIAEDIYNRLTDEF